MLVVLPLGLFSIAVLFDVMYLVTGGTTFAEVAFWNITVGIVGGLLAAVFGLIDSGSRSQGHARKADRCLARRRECRHRPALHPELAAPSRRPRPRPELLPFVLGLVAVVAALGTAWLGGELVYRLRVAVDDDAGLDASNSLSREGVVSTSPPDRTAGVRT